MLTGGLISTKVAGRVPYNDMYSSDENYVEILQQRNGEYKEVHHPFKVLFMYPPKNGAK